MSIAKSGMPAEPETGRHAARLVVGLGSPHGDDQAGWVAADALEARLQPPWAVRKISSAFDLLSLLEGQDELILIDAAAPRDQPGQIRAFEWPCGQFATGAAASSHGVGLASALHLAEVLGCLPGSVRVFTVEALSCEPMSAIRRPVADGVQELVAILIEELEVTAGWAPARREVPCTKPRS